MGLAAGLQRDRQTDTVQGECPRTVMQTVRCNRHNWACVILTLAVAAAAEVGEGEGHRAGEGEEVSPRASPWACP